LGRFWNFALSKIRNSFPKSQKELKPTDNNNNNNNIEVQSRRVVYAIIAILVLEGVCRKLASGGLSIIIFFIKDLLCVMGLYYIVRSKLTAASKEIASKIKLLIMLLYPLLCYNLFLDPILFVWGAKIYLLYTVMAVLMPIAFPFDSKDKFKRFFEFILLLLVISVFTGLYQLTLPPSHWLNQDIQGESLEAFSAAGMLRISSTFSFTGQYSFFLTFASAIFFCNYFLTSSLKTSLLENKWIKLATGILLFLGCFSTGGRTAVYGLLVVVVLGFFLMLLKSTASTIKKSIIPIVVFILLIPVIKLYKPDAFLAFEARSSSESQNAEMLDRVFDPFSDALIFASDKETVPMLFGSGLGVMTNGADKVSAYAKEIRATMWTESDFRTIVWEGGIYLIFAWYFFRLFIILWALKTWASIKDINNSLGAVFLVAYIILQGLTGTLTLQPPLAIYFWLCCGALKCIQEFDLFQERQVEKTI
jgi:hypothetical protein